MNTAENSSNKTIPNNNKKNSVFMLTIFTKK